MDFRKELRELNILRAYWALWRKPVTIPFYFVRAGGSNLANQRIVESIYASIAPGPVWIYGPETSEPEGYPGSIHWSEEKATALALGEARGVETKVEIMSREKLDKFLGSLGEAWLDSMPELLRRAWPSLPSAVVAVGDEALLMYALHGKPTIAPGGFCVVPFTYRTGRPMSRGKVSAPPHSPR